MMMSYFGKKKTLCLWKTSSRFSPFFTARACIVI